MMMLLDAGCFLPAGLQDKCDAFLDDLDAIEVGYTTESTATDVVYGLLTCSSPTMETMFFQPLQSLQPQCATQPSSAPQPKPVIQVPPPSVWLPSWPDCEAPANCCACSMHKQGSCVPAKHVPGPQTIFPGGSSLAWQASTPSSGESASEACTYTLTLTHPGSGPSTPDNTRTTVVTTGFARIDSVSGPMEALQTRTGAAAEAHGSTGRVSPAPPAPSTPPATQQLTITTHPVAAPPAAAGADATKSAARKPAGGKAGGKKRSRQQVASDVAAQVTSTGSPVKRSSKRMSCYNCGASSTPQWRCGPDGPRTLCNACGVRYKKGLPLAYKEAEAKLQGAAAAAAAQGGEDTKTATPQ